MFLSTLSNSFYFFSYHFIFFLLFSSLHFCSIIHMPCLTLNIRYVRHTMECLTHVFLNGNLVTNFFHNKLPPKIRFYIETAFNTTYHSRQKYIFFPKFQGILTAICAVYVHLKNCAKIKNQNSKGKNLDFARILLSRQAKLTAYA